MSIAIQSMAPLLQVFDMPASLAFYRDALGFEVLATAGPPDDIGWAHLRRNGVEVMLNTQYETGDRPSSPDPARGKAHGDTALYFGCPDVDAAYEHLRARGLDVAPPVVTGYGMKQVYVRDPDGYNLCFQWPVH